MSAKDIVEAEARAAEAAEGGEPVRDLSEVDIKRGRNRTEVLQVRLNKEEYEAVRAAAGDLPVSTYVRAVLLQAVSPVSEVVGPVWTMRSEPAADAAYQALKKLAETLQVPRAPDDVAQLLNRRVAPLEARLEALEKHSA
ncbi:hypothetical protein [Promicromonospora sp. NPDC023805]|uniref:hypothetical protein n=1 Tax=Promicromonospora sp. NPDC023805 TaxID=3154696 RepID=UPI00340E70F2